MPVLRLNADTIKKGWAPDMSGSNTVGVEAPPGYYSKSVAMSPFRPGRIGQLSAGEVFTALQDSGGRVTALPLNAVVDSSGEAFAILANARVVQFGVGDNVIDAHNATAHGAHSGLSGEDILAYKNATDEYVLYSFNDATDGDVGRRTKTGGAYVDNWLSTLATQTNGSALTAGVPHKMRTGPDGVIYITNGQYLAAHAPNTTEVDYKALNLGYGFVATALDVDGPYLKISGYQATTFITSFSRSESRAWFWDCTPGASYNFVIDLEDNYASALIANGRYSYAFTNGRSNTTKIKAQAGNYYQTLFESAQIGEPPRPGSVEIYQGMVHYAPKNGSQLFCIDGTGFHYRTVVTTDGQSTPLDLGMVKNLSTNLLYVGRKSGASSYDIVRIDLDKYHINADWRSPIFALPRGSRITKIVLLLSQWGPGASLLLSLFKNYSTISLGGADDLLNKTLTYTALGPRSSISVPVKNGLNIDAGLLNVRWNHASTSATAAIIREIEVHYEVTKKP